MSHPIISAANANLKYQALLQEAETHNRLKKRGGDRSGWSTAVAASLGAYLITAGKKLKGQPAPNTKIAA